MAAEAQIGTLDPRLYQPLSGDAAPPAALVTPPATASGPTPSPIDHDLLQQMMGSSTPEAAPIGPGAVDHDLLKQMMAGPASAPSASSGVSPHHTTAHGPTRFQQATAPSSGDEPELSWGQVGQQALHNALPSLAGAAGSIWSAVSHPVQTVENIGDVGKGLISQAAGAIGLHQDPAEKAKAEAAAKALESHYGQAYGSVKGFKKYLATDPASALMDASLVADPLAGAFGKVGEVGKLGALADAAKVASKALPYVNPIKSALAVARAPGAIASWAGRGAGSVTSRVPLSALQIATQIGRDGDPIAQAAFTKFATGQGDATEILQNAQGRLSAIKQAASAKYMANKGELANAPVDFSNTYDALNEADKQLGYGATAGNADQKATVAALRQWVDDVSNSKNTLLDADGLKQQIWAHEGLAPTKYIGPIYNALKKDIIKTDPGYGKLMDQYQDGLNNITDLTKTLGLGNKAAASGMLVKSLRALKTGTGQNLLQQIMEGNPELRGALAGSAINPWSQHGSVWEMAIGAGLPGALVHPLAAAGLIPGAVAGWAASSPRVVGSAANLAGKAGRNLDRLSGAAPQAGARGAYYAGRAGQGSPSAGTDNTATPASSDDIDAATRMVLAEAGNQSDQGKLAALYAFINRAKASGKPLAAEINAPWAAESITKGLGRKFDPSSPVYKKIRDSIVMPALTGQVDDPTGGMTHFLNKALQLQEGRKIPSWAAGEGLKIGDHTFYSAAGGRIERASGGKVDDQVERLVQRLMSKAKLAKRQTNAATKPLLNVPDSVVARALDIANRAAQ